MKKLVGTIDCTPTWESLVPAMLEALETGTRDMGNKQVIREEFARMARAADLYVASQRLATAEGRGE